MLLTDIAVKNAKPKDKGYKITDGRGMFLLVQPNEGKYWRYKYRFGGKEKTLALGTYPDTTLAEARERHVQARKALAAGNDPGEVKKHTKRTAMLKSETTFEAIAREWYQNNVHTWTPKHAYNVIRRLEADIRW